MWHFGGAAVLQGVRQVLLFLYPLLHRSNLPEAESQSNKFSLFVYIFFCSPPPSGIFIFVFLLSTSRSVSKPLFLVEPKTSEEISLSYVHVDQQVWHKLLSAN